VQELSYENEPVGGNNFDMNGFECILDLTQKQKETLKCPIPNIIKNARGRKQ